MSQQSWREVKKIAGNTVIAGSADNTDNAELNSSKRDARNTKTSAQLLTEGNGAHGEISVFSVSFCSNYFRQFGADR
jgi:hypothetical protein